MEGNNTTEKSTAQNTAADRQLNDCDGTHHEENESLRSLLLDPCLVSRFHKTRPKIRSERPAGDSDNQSNAASSKNDVVLRNQHIHAWKLVFLNNKDERARAGKVKESAKDDPEKDQPLPEKTHPSSPPYYPTESYLELRVRQNAHFCTTCLEQGLALQKQPQESNKRIANEEDPTNLAEAYFRQGLEVDPQHADLWVALALLQANKKPATAEQTKTFHYEHALSSLENALKYQPRHPQALEYQQQIQEQLKKLQERQQERSRRQRAPIVALQDVQAELALHQEQAPLDPVPETNVESHEDIARESDSSSEERRRRRKRRRKREKERERKKQKKARRERQRRKHDYDKKRRKKRRKRRRRYEYSSNEEEDSDDDSRSSPNNDESSAEDASREYHRRNKRRTNESSTQRKKRSRRSSPSPERDNKQHEPERNERPGDECSNPKPQHKKDEDEVSSLSSGSQNKQKTLGKRNRRRKRSDDESYSTVDSLELISRMKRRNRLESEKKTSSPPPAEK